MSTCAFNVLMVIGAIDVAHVDILTRLQIPQPYLGLELINDTCRKFHFYCVVSPCNLYLVQRSQIKHVAIRPNRGYLHSFYKKLGSIRSGGQAFAAYRKNVILPIMSVTSPLQSYSRVT